MISDQRATDVVDVDDPLTAVSHGHPDFIRGDTFDDTPLVDGIADGKVDAGTVVAIHNLHRLRLGDNIITIPAATDATTNKRDAQYQHNTP